MTHMSVLLWVQSELKTFAAEPPWGAPGPGPVTWRTAAQNYQFPSANIVNEASVKCWRLLSRPPRCDFKLAER